MYHILHSNETKNRTALVTFLSIVTNGGARGEAQTSRCCSIDSEGKYVPGWFVRDDTLVT